MSASGAGVASATPLEMAALVVVLGLLLFAPGYLIVRLLPQGRDGFQRLALAAGLSLALWPLVLLWTTLVGLTWTSTRAALVLALVTALVFLARGMSLARSRLRRPGWPDPATWSMWAVLAIAVVSRTWHAHDLVVPPWVDGYHHTLITRLITLAGGVPDGFEPFLAVDRFFYHFGFHTVAAMGTWVSGRLEATVVLWLGQALNVLAVPAAYLLARALGMGRLAAVLAAAVPAGLDWFPAYYLSWGRYTQLAGLVMLPVAWVLAHDALLSSARLTRAAVTALAAGLVAAGLVLTHYRVTVAYGLGMVVLVGGLALSRRLSRQGVTALLVLVSTAAIASGPWLARVAAEGIGTLRAASPTWYAALPEVDTVPSWLFTVGANSALLRLAGVGLLAAMVRGRSAAWLAAVTLVLLFVAVHPAWLGLPPSWMLPPFALAIGAWLAVAAGLAWLADTAAATYRPSGDRPWVPGRRTVAAAMVLTVVIAYAWHVRDQPPLSLQALDIIVLVLAALALGTLARGLDPPAPPQRYRHVAAAAVVALTLAGAWAARDVLNRSLVLAEAADLAAAGWVAAETPSQARFLVRAGHWQLGTYRGLDGGYWLPLLADRATSMPAIFYNYGDRDYGLGVAEVARALARGDALGDDDLALLMERIGADYIYLGPAGTGREDALSAERLDQVQWLRRVYDAGGVTIFKRLPPNGTADRPGG